MSKTKTCNFESNKNGFQFFSPSTEKYEKNIFFKNDMNKIK